MSLAEKISGKWLLVNSENFDEYLKEVGVGLITRKMAVTLKPSLTIQIDGNKWKITSESTFKTLVWEFELGQEAEQTTGDGRQVKSIFTIEGDKLIQLEKATKSDQKDSKFERYVNESGQLIVVCQCGEVVAKRTYSRAP